MARRPQPQPGERWRICGICKGTGVYKTPYLRVRCMTCHGIGKVKRCAFGFEHHVNCSCKAG